jgi:hypothetical protein
LWIPRHGLSCSLDALYRRAWIGELHIIIE